MIISEQRKRQNRTGQNEAPFFHIDRLYRFMNAKNNNVIMVENANSVLVSRDCKFFRQLEIEVTKNAL